MGRAYSMDLRERVVAAVAEEGLSSAGGGWFGISDSTAINWLKRVATTGSVAPGQIGGHKPRKIAGAHRDWLVGRCRERDFTLRGLVAELAERGLKVDYRSVWEFVHAEKLSHKKRRRSRPNRTAPTWRGDEPNGRRGSSSSIRPALSLSTRPGPRPTWPRSGAGRRAANACPPRCRMAMCGRPLQEESRDRRCA